MPSKMLPIHHLSFIIHHSSFPISLPHLVLSDLMMPVMDGYQLLEKLKSDDATRHIPVVMLTARAEAQDKLKALRIGVDDYLLKPFDEDELLARIENLLKNYAARRAAAAEESEPSAGVPLLSRPDREWLEVFEGYVRKHLSSDLLSVAELTREFAMSESTLLRQLKRLTGLTPVQYLLEVRLTEARRLLENRTFSSIAQVAARVGYDDARSFSRAFRQRFGKLPSEVMEV
jgi:YesN/AraC family two-component response regulator